MVIARAVLALPPDRQQPAARAAVAAAEPLGFANEVYRAMQREVPGTRAIVARDKDAKRLGEVLAKRVVATFGDQPLWEAESGWVWLLRQTGDLGHRSAVKAAMKRWLRADPQRVRRVLGDLAGKLYSGSEIKQADLDRSTYDAIEKLVSLAEVRLAIRKVAPRRRPTEWPEAAVATEPDLAVIDQFLLTERAVAESAAAPTE